MGDPPQHQQQQQQLVAVSDVRDAVPVLSSSQKPPLRSSQTRAVGVILPPPDIRAILEKTAQFVGKNGSAFERKILESERDNAKFQFLVPSNPYHAFYQQKVQEYSSNSTSSKMAQEDKDKEKERGGEKGETTTTTTTPPHTSTAPAFEDLSVPVTVVATKTLEKPDDELYTVHWPNGLSALDVDLMKITAQFVARHGKSFLRDLSHKESMNPQFSFLKPTHSLFGYFSTLADAYVRVLLPPKPAWDRLEQDAADRGAILTRCLKRLEYDKALDRERVEADEAKERERMEMMSIDWHDFTVVATIDFDDQDDTTTTTSIDDDNRTVALPPPMTLQDLLRFRKNQHAAVQMGLKGATTTTTTTTTTAPKGQTTTAANIPPTLGAAAATTALDDDDDVMEVEMDMDEEEAALVEHAAVREAHTYTNTNTNAAVDEDDEDDEDDDEFAKPIKVVKDYQRSGPVHGVDATKYVASPFTGELVPVADMEQHMRISLLDPRWKEQREAMLSKLRDTTKASDEELTANLVGLAKTRPDIFGTRGDELTKAMQQQQQQQQQQQEEEEQQARGGTKRPLEEDPGRSRRETRQRK